MEADLHRRLLLLRDAAFGSFQPSENKAGDNALVGASYDCVLDALLAVYQECQNSSLAKERNVAKFLKKYESTVKEINKLIMKEEDFENLGIVGQGHFGEVRVVQERSTGETYAMKVMNKSHILKQADAAFFLEERDIMAVSTSQWLTSLHYAFQDEHSLYLVMDYHPGGDLLTVMERREEGMGEEEARFYLAEITAGLHDLHKLGFAHRDVKPENVLISRSGHIKLVDFGSAARLDKNGKVVESNLPVGTPEYISPEVLKSLDQKPQYGVCCDWWSVGIILYELLYNRTPFESRSTAETYANIMSYETSLHFPEEISVSPVARDLVQHLLTNPETRLTYSEITSHAFFAPTNWKNLTASLPPFIPSISGPADMSHFDTFEPKDDDTSFTSGRRSAGFSGKGLLFVGFSFTRWPSSGSSQLDLGANSLLQDGLGKMVNDLQQTLESCQQELAESRHSKATLEKECVIYQSQLQDLHRQLEMERHGRMNSESRALQLLSEIRDRSQKAQELRDSESKVSQEKIHGAVAQLEQERILAINRAKRMQEELQKKQLLLDAATGKVADLRARVARVKECGRKEIEELQTKLAKVTKDLNARNAELKHDYLETLDKKAWLSDEVSHLKKVKQQLEEKLEKAVGSLQSPSMPQFRQQLQVVETERDEARSLVAELTTSLQSEKQEHQSVVLKNRELEICVKALEENVESLNKEWEKLEASESSLKEELNSARADIQQLHTERKELLRACDELSSKRDLEVEAVHNQEKTLLRSGEQLESKLSALDRLKETTSQETSSSSTVLVELEEERKRLQNSLQSTVNLLEKSEKDRLAMEKEQDIKITQLIAEVSSLKQKLSSTTDSALKSSERLMEVRRAKRELGQECQKVKAALQAQQDQAKQEISQAEALTKAIEEKYTKLLSDVDGLEDLKKKIDDVTAERESLLSINQRLNEELKSAREKQDKTLSTTSKLSQSLKDANKQLEAQELNLALLKRNVSMLEEQLADAQAVKEESQTAQAEWKEEKKLMENDLDMAETRLDEANKNLVQEKEARSAAEMLAKSLQQKVEESESIHSCELQELQHQLDRQREMASQFSQQVSELRKEQGLARLKIEDTERALDVEKALSSKLYDDIQNLSRDHGKLKAAHMKATACLQQQRSRLEVVSREVEQALQDKANAEETLQLEKTKLQTQIAQFTKLVDYKTATPGKKPVPSRKGLKLGRKSRNPAKEIDEWNTLKGIAKKSRVKEGSHYTLSSPSIQSFISSTSVDNASTPSMLQPDAPMESTPVNQDSGEMALLHAGTAGNKRPNPSSRTMQHNIPHRFAVKSTHFHKTLICSTCKGSIKHTQKYSKCSYCSVVCHPKCVDSTPNTCGLNSDLADKLYPANSNKRSRPSIEDDDHDVTSTGTTDKENMSSQTLVSKRSWRPTSTYDSSPTKLKAMSVDIIRCHKPRTPPSPPILSLDASPMSTKALENTSISIHSSMMSGNSTHEPSDFSAV